MNLPYHYVHVSLKKSRLLFILNIPREKKSFTVLACAEIQNCEKKLVPIGYMYLKTCVKQPLKTEV